MHEVDENRVALRREAHDLNDGLADFVGKLLTFDPDAAGAVKRARSALFEAWTILCTPPSDEEDH